MSSNPNTISTVLLPTNSGKDYFFMVLEYCNMGNLLNEQVKKPQKVMPYDEAVRIAASVLSGLGEIHRNKFVHRDIKP
jgi:serine/threonine protein kinase